MPMDRTNIIIKQIAKREGKSVNAVRREIAASIKDAYSNQHTRKWWNELFGEGVIPTPEQFLDVMVEELKNKNKLF